MKATDFQIRAGTPKDIPSLLRLIRELAVYEKAETEVTITEEQLLADGFGPNAIYKLQVAELGNHVVGIALYYFAYSTWKGKYLYLEDFVVDEKFRGKGIGKLLFDSIVTIAKKEKVKRMGWQVLDWNKSAIRFYENYGADMSSEWLNGRLYFE